MGKGGRREVGRCAADDDDDDHDDHMLALASGDMGLSDMGLSDMRM